MPYPVSDEFKTAVKHGHQIATRFEIYADDTLELVANTVREGQATEDIDQKNRRRATLTLVDEDGTIIPEKVGDLFTPYGNEFRPYRGVTFGDGHVELVPQGVFVFTQVQVADTGPDLRLDCEGVDRSIRHQRDKFRLTYVVAKDTPIETAVATIAQSTIPDVQMTMSPGQNFLTPRTVFDAGMPKWDAMTSLADSCGCDLYYDVNGTLVMTTPQDYTTVEPDWVLEDNEESVMLYLERTMSISDDFTNDVIVHGTGTTTGVTMVWAEVFDSRVGSPTSVVGKLGPVVRYVEDSKILSIAQATEAAARYLTEGLRKYEDIDCLIVPNPAMQAGDVVTITRERAKMNSVKIVLDQVSQPFVPIRGGEAMARRLV